MKKQDNDSKSGKSTRPASRSGRSGEHTDHSRRSPRPGKYDDYQAKSRTDTRDGLTRSKRIEPAAHVLNKAPLAQHTPQTPKAGRMEGIHVQQPVVPADLSGYVDLLLDAIDIAVPLPAAHRKDLKFAIRDLSRELTSERTERRRDYLGMPANHSAYLRYFLPWNVLRISQIAANLEIKLKDGDQILDIGSGPWTLPIAFWIGCPELRTVKLRWVLGDRVKKPLDSGKAIFEAFMKLVQEKNLHKAEATSAVKVAGTKAESQATKATEVCPWEFTCVREQFPGLAFQKRDKPFALITAANVLNELFWDERVHLDFRARKVLETFGGNAAQGTRLLIIEPGEPRSGTMISALRESLLISRGRVLSPCTHIHACPMPGSYLGAAMRAFKAGAPVPEGVPELVNMPASRTKYPWCHFVLNSAPAPKRLLMLSELAGIPKDRLVASWLYAELPNRQGKAQKPSKGFIRLVSDKILANGKSYRYACGEAGYIMAGPPLSQYPSGTVIGLEDQKSQIPGTLDRKTHALLLE